MAGRRVSALLPGHDWRLTCWGSAFAYCKDNKTGVLYLHGTGSKLANMDIDCDGDQSDHGDGRCGSSDDTQSTTAFKDLVQKYSRKAGNAVSDLNANFIPYVVFGNHGKKDGYTNFHPEDFGLRPLTVMAVVCGDQLVSENQNNSSQKLI